MKSKKKLLFSSILSSLLLFSACSDDVEQAEESLNTEKNVLVINSKKEEPIITVRNMINILEEDEKFDDSKDLKYSIAAFYIKIRGEKEKFSLLDGNTSQSLIDMKDDLIKTINKVNLDLLTDLEKENQLIIKETELFFMKDSLERRRAVYHAIVKNNSENPIVVFKIFVNLYNPDTDKIMAEDVIRHRIKDGLKPGEEVEFYATTKTSSPLAAKDLKPWHKYMYSYVLKTYKEGGVETTPPEGSFDKSNEITRKIEDLKYLDNLVSKRIESNIIDSKFKLDYNASSLVEESYRPDD